MQEMENELAILGSAAAGRGPLCCSRRSVVVAKVAGSWRLQLLRDLRLITEPNKSSAKPGQNDITA
jgi:hypothetical protein